MGEREDFFKIAYSLKTSDETRAMYDRWASVYDLDLENGDYRQPARCAAALKAQLATGEALILDVGCGTGLSGMALRQAGYSRIDGCDLSKGMLDKAANLRLYNRLFTCDLNQPPLDVGEETYDAVTAVGVFSFGHLMPGAVDELIRITKPDGFMIIGLNDHYYEEGSLNNKLDQLEACGSIRILNREHGEHIPKNDLKGWVITTQKNRNMG